MSYNHGLEEKKFKEQWQKTAEEYRKATLFKCFKRSTKTTSWMYRWSTKKNGVYELGIVAIQPGETKEKLEELAHKIKNEVLNENTNIINEYKASLGTDNMPKNVRIQREFMNQYLFSQDGFLCIFSAEALLESDRLKIVDEEMKKAVGQIVIMK